MLVPCRSWARSPSRDWVPQWCLLLLAVALLLAAGRKLRCRRSGRCPGGAHGRLRRRCGLKTTPSPGKTPRLAYEQAILRRDRGPVDRYAAPGRHRSTPSACGAAGALHVGACCARTTGTAAYFNGPARGRGICQPPQFPAHRQSSKQPFSTPVDGTTFARFLTASGMAVTREGRSRHIRRDRPVPGWWPLWASTDNAGELSPGGDVLPSVERSSCCGALQRGLLPRLACGGVSRPKSPALR